MHAAHAPSSGRSADRSAPRLWIDLDNSPHVPLFAPLIRHLRGQGWEVNVTARDFAQTLDLVEQLKLDAVAVGEHAGRSKVKKVLNLPVRTSQLIGAVRSFRPEIALSHGSRTQTLAARVLGIPKIVMFDYEWTEMSIFKRFASILLCPRAISADRLGEAGIPLPKVRWYDGFKEDLYLPDFQPDPGFRASLDVADRQRLVTIRPPGIIGNYHDERSEAICRRLIEMAASDPENVLVILPKTRLERELVAQSLPADARARVLVPERALPGLQLLHASDLAVSGGGTMNREAALLGVPAYSMFTGRRAAIDEELARRGLLRFLEVPGDVDSIDWRRRWNPGAAAERPDHRLLYELEEMIRTFAAPLKVRAA
jgi:predicted glycosyltransferase